MIYTVQITARAERKLTDLYEYISQQLLAPTNAHNQISRLKDKILSLDMFPKRYRVYSTTLYEGHELRRLLVDNFSVFYYIDGNNVIVVDLIYSRANVLAHLKDN